MVRFYSQQAASLVPRVSECVTRNTALLESRSSGTGMDVGWLDACMAEIERLATECKDLLEYVSLNMAAIRKVCWLASSSENKVTSVAHGWSVDELA